MCHYFNLIGLVTSTWNI